MKKSTSLLWAAAAFALLSCTEEIQPETPVQPEPLPQGEPFELFLGAETDGEAMDAEDPLTRTLFNPADGSLKWSEGDKVSVLVEVDGKFEYHLFTKNPANADGFLCTDFQPVEGKTYTYNVIYPEVKGWTGFDKDNFTNAQVPQGAPKNGFLTQNGVNNTDHIHPAVCGKVENVKGTAAPTVKMKHLCAIVRVKLDNQSGKDIRVTAVRMNTSEAAFMGGGAYIRLGDCGHKLNINYSDVFSELKVENAIVKKGEVGAFYLCVPYFRIAEGRPMMLTMQTSIGAFTDHKISTDKDLVFARGHVCTTTFTAEAANKNYPVEYTATDKLVDFDNASEWDPDTKTGIVYLNTPDIPADLFKQKGKLTGVKIPDFVRFIGKSAFGQCSGLKTVEISPSSQLRELDAAAFGSCTGIESPIVFPKTMMAIGNQSLNPNTVKPLVIQVLSPKPFKVQTSSFHPERLQHIVVPQASVAAYKKANGWIAFESKIIGDEDYAKLK